MYDYDRIIVPPLEGFVMNRVLGDYFETLLYKIFVSIDEHTSVREVRCCTIGLNFCSLGYRTLTFMRSALTAVQCSGDRHTAGAERHIRLLPARLC